MFAEKSICITPTPKGWNELSSELSTIKPDDLVVVSDMTGTLVTQTADGMLPAMRESQGVLLERGMMMVLATADSGHSVTEFLLKPLGAVKDEQLYVVHSVGAWRGRVDAGQLVELSSGADLKEIDRRTLIDAMDRAICGAVGCDTPVFSEALRDDLIGSGRRFSLTSISDSFGTQSFVEILPSKAAIFFLEEKIAGSTQQKIFSDYINDSAVVQIVADNGYQLIRGGNYVDVFTCTKEQGVRYILDYVNPTERRCLIVLGDSENDLGILSAEYPEFDRVLRVFVGQSKLVVDTIMSGPVSTEFFSMPGTHCDGSTKLFQALAKSR